jgi:hypothetical protein
MAGKNMTLEEMHRSLMFPDGPGYLTKSMSRPRPAGSSDGDVAPAKYRAFVYQSGHLAPTTVWNWNGQQFARFATPWELKRSVVTVARFPELYSARFAPVVLDTGDGDALVIGHCGTVGGVDLIAPRGVHRDDALGGTMLFVDEETERPAPPDGWFTAGYTYDTYTVLTTVDGQVVRILKVKDGDALVDANWVIDLVVAPVATKLATTGARMCASLLMRVGSSTRTLLAGPTKELAGLVIRPAARNTVREVGLEAAMAARGLRLGGWEIRMGIPRKHLAAMAQAAKETNVVAVFRANKQAAIELIERGAVGKPKSLSIPGFKSSPQTGVLTAAAPDQVAVATRNGYFLVEADGVARRTVMRGGKEVVEEMRLTNPYWRVETGQVIDPTGHPVVGDYDGLGALPLESPGRNVVPVPKDTAKGDWLGPDWERYMDVVNPKLDKMRVLHGAQDQFHNPTWGGLTDDIAYAVFPDGRAVVLAGKAEQQAFYEAFERQTAVGSYNPGVGPRPATPKELARGRKMK